MKLQIHPLQRTSFSVDIVGDEMTTQEIEGGVLEMTSPRMEVHIYEIRLSANLEASDHIAYLEKKLDGLQEQENLAGRPFAEDPELMDIPERSLLIQDGITEERIRIITYLAITRHAGHDYISIIRGNLIDDEELTTVFIKSVFASFKSLEPLS